MPEVFTFLEAQALQGYRLYATQDVTDEHGRMLIPAGSLSVVIGLSAWADDCATIAVQYSGDPEGGWFPKVILVNKTTYNQYFRSMV
jgi:hypothetical protein